MNESSRKMQHFIHMLLSPLYQFGCRSRSKPSNDILALYSNHLFSPGIVSPPPELQVYIYLQAPSWKVRNQNLMLLDHGWLYPSSDSKFWLLVILNVDLTQCLSHFPLPQLDLFQSPIILCCQDHLCCQFLFTFGKNSLPFEPSYSIAQYQIRRTLELKHKWTLFALPDTWTPPRKCFVYTCLFRISDYNCLKVVIYRLSRSSYFRIFRR